MVKRKKTTKTEEKQEQELEVNNKKLTKEQLLTIKVAHLEREAIKKDIQTLFNKMEYLEREKTICNLKMSDLKALAIKKDKEHQEVIVDIGHKVGVNLKDSVINQETGEITFV